MATGFAPSPGSGAWAWTWDWARAGARSWSGAGVLVLSCTAGLRCVLARSRTGRPGSRARSPAFHLDPSLRRRRARTRVAARGTATVPSTVITSVSWPGGGDKTRYLQDFVTKQGFQSSCVKPVHVEEPNQAWEVKLLLKCWDSTPILNTVDAASQTAALKLCTLTGSNQTLILALNGNKIHLSLSRLLLRLCLP